jgi:hypothetical protein
MPGRPKVIALDMDLARLEGFRLALPRWQVEAVNGATRESLARDRDPGEASLLVAGARTDMPQALGLCRGLRSKGSRVQPGREPW